MDLLCENIQSHSPYCHFLLGIPSGYDPVYNCTSDVQSTPQRNWANDEQGYGVAGINIEHKSAAALSCIRPLFVFGPVSSLLQDRL